MFGLGLQRDQFALDLASADIPILQRIAHSCSWPWFQVQHARILLAVWAGERIQTIVRQMQCHKATVWRVCRRYERLGFDAVLRLSLHERARTSRQRGLQVHPQVEARALSRSKRHLS